VDAPRLRALLANEFHDLVLALACTPRRKQTAAAGINTDAGRQAGSDTTRFAGAEVAAMNAPGTDASERMTRMPR